MELNWPLLAPDILYTALICIVHMAPVGGVGVALVGGS